MDTPFSDQELTQMKDIQHRLSQVRSHLSENEFPSITEISAWYSFLAKIKFIQGNFNNDISFLATLMAKKYLEERYGLQNFDAAEKPQGAAGIDIDVRLPDGRRLIAEIKTTSPYKPNDLGAQQKAMFENDFTKLADAGAEIKLFLLTEQATFYLMKKPKYKSQLSGVSVVLLTTGEEFTA